MWEDTILKTEHIKTNKPIMSFLAQHQEVQLQVLDFQSWFSLWVFGSTQITQPVETLLLPNHTDLLHS